MEDIAHRSVEQGDSHEWSEEAVDTFVRSLGPKRSLLIIEKARAKDKTYECGSV